MESSPRPVAAACKKTGRSREGQRSNFGPVGLFGPKVPMEKGGKITEIWASGKVGRWNSQEDVDIEIEAGI